MPSQVAIRYTTNNWATFDEVAASYGHNVFGANNVDAFVFSIMLPSDLKVCLKKTVYIDQRAAPALALTEAAKCKTRHLTSFFLVS